MPQVEGVKWLSVPKSEESIKYIHIAGPNKITTEEAKELGHRSFWDSLPIQENERLTKAAKEEL